MNRQQPIAELLQPPQPPQPPGPLKGKLGLVLALRELAAQELKLPVNGIQPANPLGWPLRVKFAAAIS